MKSREYYGSIQSTILAAPHVLRSNISFDEVSENECYIEGILVLSNESQLHNAEYAITEPVVNRLKYRYHLQTADGKLLARWDNAPHHPEVKSHPDHLHTEKDIKSSRPIDVKQVLEAVLDFME